LHPDFFIFTLANPHGIPPTQYKLKDKNDPSHYSTGLHVSFGAADLRIAEYCADQTSMSRLVQYYTILHKLWDIRYFLIEKWTMGTGVHERSLCAFFFLLIEQKRNEKSRFICERKSRFIIFATC
jgi:hypothetical protein